MSTVGIDFDAWNSGQEMNTENGAVFFMDPEREFPSQRQANLR